MKSYDYDYRIRYALRTISGRNGVPMLRSQCSIKNFLVRPQDELLSNIYANLKFLSTFL